MLAAMKLTPKNNLEMLLPCLLAALLSACASTPQDATAQADEVQTRNEAAAPSPTAPVAQAGADSGEPGEAQDAESAQAISSNGASAESELTDAEVMYNVFAAELLGSEGDLEGAVRSYLEAAMESDDPEIARRATRVALAAQSWFQAAMAADRWALLAPDDMAAREAAAATMLATHDYHGAELQLLEILKRNPDPADGWEMVTTLLAQANDPRKANEILRTLMELQGGLDNADAIFVQSQLLARMGEFEEAARLADQAIELTPDLVPLLTFRGRLALSLDDLDTAVARFGDAWALDPENHDLGLAYADLLARAARAEEARAVMESMQQTPDVLLSRILFEITAEEPERARGIYAEFDGLEGADPNERAFYQGRAAEAIGDPKAAIEHYGHVSEGEHLAFAGIRRAELIAESGDIEAARRALSGLREAGLDEITEQAWLAEARLLQQDAQVDQAFQVLGLALEEFAYSVPLRYSRALVAAELGNIEITEYDLDLVLADEPDNAAALNALGYTLADQTDRYEEAEVLIRRAYEIQPNDAAIIDSMGWVAYRLGRLEEAESFLSQAWSLDKNPEIAAHLGEVLWAMGKQNEARDVWQEGLQVDAEHPLLLDTIDRMGAEL